ncbi:MAG: hypothetical protein DME26_02610, partial [Verrucomicrobia bacterium]
MTTAASLVFHMGRAEKLLSRRGVEHYFIGMTDVLEALAKSPRLPRYLAELQRLIETEHQYRQRFYEEMSASQKAEFI